MEYRYVLFFVVLVVLGVALFAFCKNNSSGISVSDSIRLHFLEKHGVTLNERVSFQRSFGHYSVYFLWNTGHIVTWNEEKCCLIDCPMCKLEGLSNKLNNCIKRLEKSLLDDETEENLSK